MYYMEMRNPGRQPDEMQPIKFKVDVAIPVVLALYLSLNKIETARLPTIYQPKLNMVV